MGHHHVAHRRVWVVVVTTVTVVTTVNAHLNLVLVPSPLVVTVSAVFVVGMRTRRLSVASAASHTCLPPSVSVVVVAELAEFKV